MKTHQVPIRELSYFNTGGTSLGVISPSSPSELQASIKNVAMANLPLMVLGGGTNSLVLDDDYSGYVVVFRGMKKIVPLDHLNFEVEAGVTNTEFAHFAHQRGLTGAGWMNYLPGEIGGTVRMNARCYGGEISQIVTKIFTFDRGGNKHEYKGSDVFRGYKDTLLMENNEIVFKVHISLKPGNASDIWREMEFCRRDRESKGQFNFPTCGCIFKNNYDPEVSVSSGYLLELAEAKSLRLNGAEVSKLHANFVYNQGATSRSILELTFLMREVVWNKFGVWLEYEMEILGQLPKDLSDKVLERRDSIRTPAQSQALKEARNQFSIRMKAANEKKS
jgi:UDP-N-acetylmuramate dehydrogenase